MTKRTPRKSNQKVNPLLLVLVPALITTIGVIMAAYITRPVAPTATSAIAPTSPPVSAVLTPAPTPTASPAIVITAPEDGSQVDFQVAVAGALNADLCAGCEVYVVIRPEVVEAPQTRWYGQTQAAAVEAAAVFTLGGVNIGRNSTDDDCKWFELWVVSSPADLTGIRMSDQEWDAVPKVGSAMVRVQRHCPAAP